MEILSLSPAFKDYLWGGTRLIDDFGFTVPLNPVAEAWMLSTHKDGNSVVSSGEYCKKDFSEVIKKHPEALGTSALKFDRFPMLIKLIDARDNLSVQVHPDNEYALKNEKEYGKTEMWYIVDCEKDAGIYYGFKGNYSKDEVKRHIENGTLCDILNFCKVKRGDCFFIEAGTVHAIGKGILIAEIQQNSNTTYRVFDYNRKDKNGNTRELHIEKALDVMKIQKPTAEVLHTECNAFEPLFCCDFFKTAKRTVNGSIEINVDKTSFSSIIVLEGEIDINGVNYKKGSSLFIPADTGSVIISGKAILMESRI